MLTREEYIDAQALRRQGWTVTATTPVGAGPLPPGVLPDGSAVYVPNHEESHRSERPTPWPGAAAVIARG
jgi:DNA-binding beta-propeller fold protein YncE